MNDADATRPDGGRASILVLGRVEVGADRLTDALALSLDHVRRSRAEPGCLSHAVHQDAEAPLTLVFVERWASREALWAHFALPASRAFARELANLACATPTLALYVAQPLPLPPRPRAGPAVDDAGAGHLPN